MKQHQYVDVIRRSGQNVLALVDDIMDLAALETGRSAVEVTPFDLAAAAREVLEQSEVAAREKGIPLQANLPRAPLFARGDEPRLRHVLARMIEHVLLSTDHGYVEVAVEREGAAATLGVRNTPDGLSEGARRALEREADPLDGFAQASAAQAHILDGETENGGVALPLTIAARLARRAGAPIRQRLGLDEGLSLELTLPLAAQADAGAGRVERGPRHAGGRILLVDDDAAERIHVTARLEEAGYTITPASSGSEALARLGDAAFDAVVLDLVMPGLSGLEVLRAARLDQRLRHLPFVVLSALYMTQSERAVLGPSVASVVRKGDGTADDLLRALARALAPGEAATLHGGDRHA